MYLHAQEFIHQTVYMHNYKHNVCIYENINFRVDKTGK